MKLGLIQLNPTVGALSDNSTKLLDAALQAQRQGADIAVASELSVCGYPPRDWLDHPRFVQDTLQVSRRIVETPLAIPLVFGTLGLSQGRLTNDAVVAQNGREVGRATKQLLPAYDVFDESRYFSSGDQLLQLTLAGRRCALTICEDAWGEAPELTSRYPQSPLAALRDSGVEWLLNVSASPFTLHKPRLRRENFSAIARRYGTSVAFVNQVGGNDELLFDGQSALWDPSGALIARAKSFEEDLLVVDAHAPAPLAAEAACLEQAAYQALVMGVRDYLRKCGFTKAVLGLSGGIDSALVATLAVDALGADNVLGVAMPTRYSSAHSLEDARQLATHLGMRFEVVDIEPLFASTLATLEAPLERQSEARGGDDVTWENVQARLRGMTVMALSNRTGALALTTGNKSELAVGYCTLYGDMAGGLAVLSDVPKTWVYRISRWLNRDVERIPQRTLSKAPSAELRPDQTDQDSLPPYDVLDAILEAYIEQHQAPDELVAAGHDPAVVRQVVKLVNRSEYKRRQAAPGLILTRKAFGPGRRIPVAQRYG